MVPASDDAGPGSAARSGGGRPSDQGVRWRAVVEVDGETLPLKEFLHDLIGGACAGLLSGLRGVEAPAHLRLEITRLSEDPER